MGKKVNPEVLQKAKESLKRLKLLNQSKKDTKIKRAEFESMRSQLKNRNDRCVNCNSNKNIQYHHIIPLYIYQNQ